MTNQQLEVNHAFDANINQKSPELNKILFEGAYGPIDLFDLLRAQKNIGNGKFTEKEAKDFEKIFDQASRQAGASPESIRAALDERAQKLNDFFESHHMGAHVQVVVPKEKGGSGVYKDCSYAVVVTEYHAKTDEKETVGFVRWRDPKIANQPIEEKLKN